MAPTHSRSCALRSPALSAALLLGLSVPLADLVLTARLGLGFAVRIPLVPSADVLLAAGVLLAGLVAAFGIAWLALLPLVRTRGLSRGPLAAAVAALLAVPALAFVTERLVPGRPMASGWMAWTLVAGLASGAMLGTYRVGLVLCARVRACRWALALAFALPCTLLVAYLAQVAESALRLPVRSAGFLGLALATAALGAMLVLLLRREGPRAALERTLPTVVVLVLGAAGLSVFRLDVHAAEPGPPRTGALVPRVLLISIDTLRRDGLACYGGPEPTPSIDELAAESVLFEDAYSHAPWTLPSMASLLTGLSVPVHDVVHTIGNAHDRLAPLAERLRAAGYRTGSVGYNAWLVATPGRMQGLQRGVEDVLFAPRRPRLETAAHRVWAGLTPSWSFWKPPTDDLTRLALEWVTCNQANDWFLWVHYNDPHGPYAPPAEWEPTAPATARVGAHFSADAETRAASDFTPPDMARVRALYQAEVRWVDHGVGAILDRLRELGQYEDTLIVLTSDHGEELGEHDGFGHGHSLHEELVRVPLLVKPPGEGRPRRVAERVSLDSVLPTVLDVAGIPYEPERLTGRSLVRALTGEGHLPPRPVFATGLHGSSDGGQRSVVFGHHKLIRHLDTGREQLFDLEDDPREQRDLASEQPDLVELGRDLLDLEDANVARLRAELGLESEAPGAAEEPELDARTEQLLRSLGYL